MSLIVSQNGKNAKKIERSSFSSEDSLQKYIYENPEVIPIDEIEEGLRLFVAAREFQVGSGRIDALGFDQKGNIYIVETKLARNSDKREVVAQVLDYGAALWGNIDLQTFFNSLSEHTERKYHKSFADALAEYYELEDASEVLEQIEKNLSEGNLRFLVMMDEIEPHLKDLVRFINQNSKYDLYALETSMYKNGDQEILITQIFGDEIKKGPGMRAKSSLNTWAKGTEEEFVKGVCEQHCDPKLKTQILKVAGILKNVFQAAFNDNVEFYHVKSTRLDVQRISGHVFYFDQDGKMNVFITHPSWRDNKMAEFFRLVWVKVVEQKIFDVENPDEHKTVWLVPSSFTLEQYVEFANICEQIARQKGFISSYSEEDFRRFVRGVKWITAKTYEKTTPHEYVVIKDGDDLRDDYLKLVKFLFENGVRVPFYDKSYQSYFLDERQYWVMEQSFEEVDNETIILNRTKPEDTFKIYGSDA